MADAAMADRRPLRLLIVWFSRTGGTRQLAQAAARGAARAADADSGTARRVDVVSIEAGDADGSDVLAADGYIFASPENLASMAGTMKDFFDRSYYAALDRINGRPYALIVCAGSDGEGAVRQIERIATGWRLRPISAPLIVNVDAQTPVRILSPKTIGADPLARAEELGEALAAGLAMGLW